MQTSSPLKIHADRSDKKLLTIPEYADDFIQKVRHGKDIKEIRQDAHCVIFIHGFNNKSKDIFDREEDIDEALATKQVALTGFNWQSKGNCFRYFSDQDEAERMAPALVEFIQAIKKTKEFERIQIIAHSMGNYLLCEAILLKDAACVFKDCDIVCLAADAKKSKYNEAISAVKEFMSSWTHFYYPYDKALLVSQVKNSEFKHGIIPELNHRAGLFPCEMANESSKIGSFQWPRGDLIGTNHGYIDDLFDGKNPKMLSMIRKKLGFPSPEQTAVEL